MPYSTSEHMHTQKVQMMMGWWTLFVYDSIQVECGLMAENNVQIQSVSSPSNWEIKFSQKTTLLTSSSSESACNNCSLKGLNLSLSWRTLHNVVVGILSQVLALQADLSGLWMKTSLTQSTSYSLANGWPELLPFQMQAIIQVVTPACDWLLIR